MIASQSVSESSLRNLAQNLSISKVREPHEVSSKALSSASCFILLVGKLRYRVVECLRPEMLSEMGLEV